MGFTRRKRHRLHSRDGRILHEKLASPLWNHRERCWQCCSVPREPPRRWGFQAPSSMSTRATTRWAKPSEFTTNGRRQALRCLVHYCHRAVTPGSMSLSRFPRAHRASRRWHARCSTRGMRLFLILLSTIATFSLSSLAQGAAGHIADQSAARRFNRRLQPPLTTMAPESWLRT